MRPRRLGRVGGFAVSLAIHLLLLLCVLVWPAVETRSPGATGPRSVRITLVGEPGAAPADVRPVAAGPVATGPVAKGPGLIRPALAASSAAPAAPSAVPAAPSAIRIALRVSPTVMGSHSEATGGGRGFPASVTAPPGTSTGAPGGGSAQATGQRAEDLDCHIGQSLEAALRRNPRVGDAVAQARRLNSPFESTIVVWNGDWIRSRDEDGKGLAAVREAISLEIVSAQAKCLAQPMRGPIVIMFGRAAGYANIAIGKAFWRWSDLLTSP